MKEILLKNIWFKTYYYKIAESGSSSLEHPAMKKLLDLALRASDILDMGCGDGTRLSKLVEKGQKGYGIDISSKAISIARKKYPNLNFLVGDLENLPYKNDSFDLVYSAFVFEHLDDPARVIEEAIRVLRPGGLFLIVSPNFGAPNRASPPYRGNRFIKLMAGLVNDFMFSKSLSWNKVEPLNTGQKYQIDDDTTIEPYLGSLLKFLKHQGLTIRYYSSCWEEELPNQSFYQRIFGFLGRTGIYPFKYWGPHLLVISEKE